MSMPGFLLISGATGYIETWLQLHGWTGRLYTSIRESSHKPETGDLMTSYQGEEPLRLASPSAPALNSRLPYTKSLSRT
jgi:hypothetical protein